ncbi:hypothetical protein YC2023_077303 [Brassica napus]
MAERAEMGGPLTMAVGVTLSFDSIMTSLQKKTIKKIEKELGHVLDEDITQGRVCIHINGLRPPEMQLSIQLPSCEIISIDLEYKTLEKHCFTSKFLSHEDSSCPLKPKTGSFLQKNNSKYPVTETGPDYHKLLDIQDTTGSLLPILEPIPHLRETVELCHLQNYQERSIIRTLNLEELKAQEQGYTSLLPLNEEDIFENVSFKK